MVVYSLGKEFAITSWKANEAYYKSTKVESFKVHTIDVMTDQRCSLQNCFIDSRPLTHPHLK
jgi:hypothetical protein